MQDTSGLTDHFKMIQTLLLRGVSLEGVLVMEVLGMGWLAHALGAQHGLRRELNGVVEQVAEDLLEPLAVTDEDIASENIKVKGSQTTSTPCFGFNENTYGFGFFGVERYTLNTIPMKSSKRCPE
jgi:hypothetical protein